MNYSAGMVRSRQILGWFQFKILSRSNPVARARITDMFFSVVLTGLFSSGIVFNLWHTLSFVNRETALTRGVGWEKGESQKYIFLQVAPEELQEGKVWRQDNF